MKEAVIVALGHSAIGKAPKGMFRFSRPEDIGAQVLAGVLQRAPGIDPDEIDDVIVGCAFPEAEQGTNLAKISASRYQGAPLSWKKSTRQPIWPSSSPSVT